VPVLCTEVSTLLGAGLNIVEAIDALASREQQSPLGGVYRTLQRRLREGLSFEQAVETMPTVFPVAFRAAVKATALASGIKGGLDRYRAFDASISSLRSKLVSSAIYPAVVVSFGLVIMLFLLGVVVPRFASIYTEIPVGASVGTRVVLAVGQWIASYPFLLLAALGIALGVLYWAFHTRRLGRWLIRAASRVPAWQAAWHDYELVRFYRSFGLLVAGGYPIVRAIENSSRVLADVRIAAGAAQATTAVLSGIPVSTALREAALADPVEERLLQAGERTAALPDMADTIAESRQDRFVRTIERSARFVEPVLLIAVGGLIAVIVLLMYFPIIDLAMSVR
jgi:general secretion pathway protein F